MERLTLAEQIRFYIQWCKDNHLEPKNGRNLVAYIQEVLCLRTQA